MTLRHPVPSEREENAETKTGDPERDDESKCERGRECERDCVCVRGVCVREDICLYV